MKKLLICLMAICLMLPLLTACNGDENVDKNVSFNENYTVQPVDMNGRTFNILCRDWGGATVQGYTGEIIYAEENPSTVDDAKRQVIDYIEGVFNCEIKGSLLPTTDNISDVIKNQIMANQHDYDIYFDSMRNASSIALEGFALDLNTVPTIDLSKEWWDQNAVNDLSVNGKLYFTCGDINTYDDQGTWCVIFNKTLKSKLTTIKDMDFYELASSGKWTFDKLVEICKESGATADKNGDGLNELDQWAFGTETYNCYVHAVAAGYKIAEKDPNTDLPYLTIKENRQATYNVIQDVAEFYKKSGNVLIANVEPYNTKYANDPLGVWGATVHKAFTEGRELFYMCGLINIASFRQMDNEFGILPVPKGTADQERYYHTVSIDNASFMFLPNNVSGESLEQLGTIISAISEASRDKVTYEYREVQLKYRDARDSESEAMLDIIFDSRTFDIGLAYGWGDLLSIYMTLPDQPQSLFEQKEAAAQTALEKTISDLQLDK